MFRPWGREPERFVLGAELACQWEERPMYRCFPFQASTTNLERARIGSRIPARLATAMPLREATRAKCVALACLTGLPLPAMAAEPGSSEFALLVMLFLAGYMAIMLLSSLPFGFGGDIVSPELLRAFARSRGLVEVPAGGAGEAAGDLRQMLRRGLSSNPAVKQSVPGSIVLRGDIHALPFMVDQVAANRWLGNTWQRQSFLRMAVELPQLPRSLQVRPAGPWARFTGRAGLGRRSAQRRDSGRLVATFSKRPVDQAKERLFLNQERCRILEAYEAGRGGLHIYDGKLFLIRRGFEVDARELDTLFEDIGGLATQVEART